MLSKILCFVVTHRWVVDSIKTNTGWHLYVTGFHCARCGVRRGVQA